MRTTILQLSTPDNMRGRVSAINGIFIGSSNELGAFESGLAARLLGLVPSVIFGGAMTLAVVAAQAGYAAIALAVRQAVARISKPNGCKMERASC